MAYVVYVLQCSSGKRYVGRCPSERVSERFQQHAAGIGAAWTRVYPASKILERRPSDDPLDEDRIVLEQMRLQGVENVRGGTYSNVRLTDAQVQSLKAQLDHAMGRCLKCGGIGHYASSCVASRVRLKSGGVKSGGVKSGRVKSGGVKSSGFMRVQGCLRCGREGHGVADCFARTDTGGRPIPRKRIRGENEEEVVDEACFRCGRSGHWMGDCYARFHANGQSIT